MHVLNFIFRVYVICGGSIIENEQMARVYYFTISQKRRSVEILARSSISPESQTKVNFLKRLPLDRGCFKLYFFKKGESLLIIPCHTLLLTCEFVILF